MLSFILLLPVEPSPGNPCPTLNVHQAPVTGTGDARLEEDEEVK